MESQRDSFFTKLFDLASKDKDIILIVADCGAPSLDRWRTELPDQFINVGIAEQLMIALASGLALSGKKPYCYAIAPFATLRCYEFIKVDVCLMNLPVVIVGVGAGLSYNDSGPTHHATEDISIMRVLPNMHIACPYDSKTAEELAQIYSSPTYIRLDREVIPDVAKPTVTNKDILVIATGNMVSKAIKYGVSVCPIVWLKPFNMPTALANYKLIITLEEHLLAGGLGSMVSEYFTDNHIPIPLTRIGINDQYFYKYGKREDIWDGEAELCKTIDEYHRQQIRQRLIARP